MKNYILLLLNIIITTIILTGCLSSEKSKMTQKISENSIVKKSITENLEQNSNIPEQNSNIPEQNLNISEQNLNIPEQNSNISEQNSNIPEQNSNIPEQNSNIPEQNSNIPEQNSNIPEQNSENQNYYYLEAQQNMLYIDMDKLKAQLRIGKISKNEFLKQKELIISQIEQIEINKDIYKNAINPINLIPNFSNLTIEEIYNMERDLEIQEKNLEIEEDNLENSYRMEQITKDEFLLKQKEILEKEHLLDIQENALEYYIDMFDDYEDFD